jgi:hypothetical protein
LGAGFERLFFLLLVDLIGGEGGERDAERETHYQRVKNFHV